MGQKKPQNQTQYLKYCFTNTLMCSGGKNVYNLLKDSNEDGCSLNSNLNFKLCK